MNVSDYTYDEEANKRTYIPTGESLRFIKPLYRDDPAPHELRLLSADGRKMNTCTLYPELITPTHYRKRGGDIVMVLSEEDKEIVDKREFRGEYIDYLEDKYGKWRVITSTDIPWKEYPDLVVPMQKYVDFSSAVIAHSLATNPNHKKIRWHTEIQFMPEELPNDQWRIWVLNEEKTRYLRKS